VESSRAEPARGLARPSSQKSSRAGARLGAEKLPNWRLGARLERLAARSNGSPSRPTYTPKISRRCQKSPARPRPPSRPLPTPAATTDGSSSSPYPSLSWWDTYSSQTESLRPPALPPPAGLNLGLAEMCTHQPSARQRPARRRPATAPSPIPPCCSLFSSYT
jgi:hypothetical protein